MTTAHRITAWTCAAFVVATLLAQTYRAGQNTQARHDQEAMNYFQSVAADMTDRAMKHPDFEAGFQACQDQF